MQQKIDTQEEDKADQKDGSSTTTAKSADRRSHRVAGGHRRSQKEAEGGWRWLRVTEDD